MTPIAVLAGQVSALSRHLWNIERLSAEISILAITAISVCTVLALAHPAKADQGDKAGWSVAVDPRKRAFLYYVPAEDGARVLTIGCLRDVDSFTI
jgi:hypothetical protein